MIFPNIKRNDIWQKWQNILSKIEIIWNILRIKNMRDMDHINGIEKYISKDFDLNNLIKLNLISVPFWFKKMFSHVMLEYVFKDDISLVLSIEARRKPKEKFLVTKWLFFWYWLIYIWWTFNDLIWLRQDIRKDKTFTYKLKLTPEEMKKSLLFFAEKSNILITKPKYYNSIFSNCTTNLWDVFNLKISNVPKKNYQVILNWNINIYLDKIWYIDNE